MNTPLNELSFVIFPGENPPEECKDIYRSAYRLWREVWTSTFRELDGDGTLYSDDMCRQTWVGCIVKDRQCIAIGMFHWVDFSLPTARDDSWFKSWPEDAITKLTQHGNKILVFSNVTVDPKFRGDLGSGLRLRDVIVGLGSKITLDLDAAAWAGTARCNRGVDKASYSAGATLLQHGKLHGVDVALVATYRKDLQEGYSFDYAVEYLWRNRVTFSGEQKPAALLPEVQVA